MSRPKQHGKAYHYVAHQQGVTAVSQSAEVIVPLLCDRFHPVRVLDLGCGSGDWLAAFLDNGVEIVEGYDGKWVPAASLRIPQGCFHEIDLYSELPSPGQFDLAICLEVAEHLASDVALKLVDFLCASADLVLWSAAIPGQIGFKHINEHYQDYWIDVFRSRGFVAFDLVRPHVWTNNKVSWWYRQNCLVFANEKAVKRYSLSQEAFIPSPIHPAFYEQIRNPMNYSLKEILLCLPHYLSRRLKRSGR